MKQVFKLCPIEARDIDARKDGECAVYQEEIYETMTADCEAVEVVDMKTLEYPEHLDGNPLETRAVNEYLYHLAQNGYKIVKEVCDE